jgi:hypothetical protein
MHVIGPRGGVQVDLSCYEDICDRRFPLLKWRMDKWPQELHGAFYFERKSTIVLFQSVKTEKNFAFSDVYYKCVTS